jgi:hypothetical protein
VRHGRSHAPGQGLHERQASGNTLTVTGGEGLTLHESFPPKTPLTSRAAPISRPGHPKRNRSTNGKRSESEALWHLVKASEYLIFQ